MGNGQIGSEKLPDLHALLLPSDKKDFAGSISPGGLDHEESDWAIADDGDVVVGRNLSEFCRIERNAGRFDGRRLIKVQIPDQENIELGHDHILGESPIAIEEAGFGPVGTLIIPPPAAIVAFPTAH